MACCYPDARDPLDLWQNVLAQRRSFRRIPEERFRLEDYFRQDPAAPDCTYSEYAAAIRDFDFDRVSLALPSAPPI
jgi:enediyne polyketide synthase